MTDFRLIIEALAGNGVKYVIVGGVAIGLHGSAYRTQDIDIVYARDRDNVARLVAALKPFRPRLRVAGEPVGVPFLFDETTILNGANFTLTTDHGDIDILAFLMGLGIYEDLSPYIDEVQIITGGPPTQILSLKGLIRSKRASGRPKDLLVLPELESMREIRELDES